MIKIDNNNITYTEDEDMFEKTPCCFFWHFYVFLIDLDDFVNARYGYQASNFMFTRFQFRATTTHNQIVQWVNQYCEFTNFLHDDQP